MVQRPARRGRLPESVSDYTNHDIHAAQMSLELVKRIRATHKSYSGFLRAHMHEDDAPHCIRGDHRDTKSFGDAKRLLSERIGYSASVIAPWTLVEFIVTRCPRQDEIDSDSDGSPGGGADDTTAQAAYMAGVRARSRLAGLWRASQRYDPPGYTGIVDLPDDAPSPYCSLDEAPTEAARSGMLQTMLARANETIARKDQELARRDECERMVIRAISLLGIRIKNLERDLEQAMAGTVNGDLLAENTRLRNDNASVHSWYSQLEQRLRNDMTGKIAREAAAHDHTASRLAMMAAMFDLVRTDGDADPVRWLRNADFPLGTDLYAILNHPGPARSPRSITARRRTDAAQPEYTAQRRFLAVYMRTYLINKFGHVPNHNDDPTGLYRSILRDGTLPSIDVLRNALSGHSVALQFAGPLLDALADAEKRAIPVQPTPIAEITPKPDSDPVPSGRISPKPVPSGPVPSGPDVGVPAQGGRGADAPGDHTAVPATDGEDGPSAPPSGAAGVRTLEVLGGDHRTGALNRPVNAVDLINNLTMNKPGTTA